MNHAILTATLLATPLVTSVWPLALRLLPILIEIGRLVADFRANETTPLSGYTFESKLQALLREMGRVIVDWTYNGLESDDPHLMPSHLQFEGDWYRRRAKSPNRHVATLFGTITLWRYLYQPIHGVERSIFPLEIGLGLAAGHATPALAERAAQAAVESSQDAVRALLRRDTGVAWSVETLRKVIAATAEGMTPHLHDAQVAQVLAWLEQADQSRGSRKPVLALGRDGVFVPIRGETCYREASTATLSVFNRAGKRLGTVYLGRMPEPGQGQLSARLTRLIGDVLGRWSGPTPRLAYITDAGHHQTEYYRRVLKPMCHPRRPGEHLEWEWVIDYYHVATYIHKLAEALFRDPCAARAWARKMCRWLKSKPRAMNRILHSAAAVRAHRPMLGAARQEAYRQAYDYLRNHLRHVDYVRYRRVHLPIGSGVTEAACKTVFSERLKRSGMGWSLEGGQRIVDLRVIKLSGVWSPVYQASLQAKPLTGGGTQQDSQTKDLKDAA